MKRFIIAASLILILFLSGMFWWRYYFVFGEGVKAGNLNFIVKKGYLFKTWEGRLIQVGFKSPIPGGLQSNDFDFSIESDSIAKILELNNGKLVELRYKEHLNSLPWRGMSCYIVTDIVSINNSEETSKTPF